MGALSRILRSVEGGRVMFWCPGCGEAHAVPVAETHILGKNWGYNGNPEAPTFTPSILVTYNGPDAGQVDEDGDRAPPAVCHSFVTDGQIQFLGDSTHALAGQTVPIPPFDRKDEV
jgi:hypothetical protein